MQISKWHGWGISGEDERLRQQNPQYALPIIVRQEKNTSVLFSDAAQAVATGLTTILGEQRFMDDQRWNRNLHTWLDGQFRKVVRRARGAQWDALTELHPLTVQHGTAEVRFLPPHPVAQTPQKVHRLQVSGLVLDGERVTAQTADRLNLAVADLGMSDGKQLAQIGHGIQLAIQHGLVTDQWASAGSLISLTPWDAQPVEAVHVVDAGLTEIAPGSHTVAAWV